ncbi:MAG: MutT protein (7,8-dihydro-8-oxoguanine-triphosphatase) [Candidatus Yanofskybacteria bacterium GW2011_GWA1_48_10]|uniref:MutT protein (7,8-dihydro-8-oxoguanine-triphosphatase) n=3 Tax=Parcubacteria group TaxID=1794811 RepID=A0A0G1WIB5_9BACT|nr:MAG: MutT protein (7,8-dihydro-8-oxoguanine-triphosphatase) [Candidatus Nomurabacteria bacterium GW2011_GWB1_47_6]KKU90053.1 MAG: MutT protein (7,8-dihydro-8-oxoguanine-triphosphatase) [Candidatus Yanofskybacteria bacterium GW2011_GWA1_48_10]OGN05971.1 MAG: hypothetical protein A2669_01220 [Candidatus Yanofskybacteria bacterium RIFCSPHIGHO2_01_FULL_48_25b]
MKEYLGVAAIIVYDRKLLLMLRDNFARRHPGRWALVGGKLEPGENFDAAIRRELKEEIGIVPEQLVEIAEYAHIDPDAAGKWSKFYFSVLTKDEYDKINKGEEGEKIDFFSIEELADLNPVGLILQNPERLEILKKMITTQKPISGL